jgi:hypothetical protein
MLKGSKITMEEFLKGRKGSTKIEKAREYIVTHVWWAWLRPNPSGDQKRGLSRTQQLATIFAS